MEDLVGRTFGGYELKEHVGAGGVASIYKGFDDRLSRWVAIKVIPIQGGQGVSGASRTNQETMLARFRLEAQAIAALRHRNILTIYGYGEEEGWAYIVMEYVPGGSLADRIEPGKPYTWEQALTITIPVSQALAFAHGHDIIHRDIKPANILMLEDDWPLLADFGLAKIEQSTKPDLTMPGQVLGTMAYAAPEQIQEVAIDSRIDIYSLGIVLYELLTGKLPFSGKSSFDFLMARLTEPPLPILEANPNVSPIFVSILDKALATNPAERYQTMVEFSQNLIEAQHQLSRVQSADESDLTPILDLQKLKQTKAALKLKTSGQQLPTGDQAELTVGRAYKNNIPDINLSPHGGARAGVSRRHGRLVREDNDWFVEDLGSTNGTFVNGHRIPVHQKAAIDHGDILRFGQIELEFSLES